METPNGWSLRDEITEVCPLYSSDRESVQTLIAAVFFGITYVIGPFIWLGALLRQAHQEGKLDEPEFVSQFGTLYQRYEPNQYYWELVVLSRKLSFILVNRLCGSSPSLQLFCCFAIVFTSLALQAYHQPFMCDALDRLELALLGAVLGVISFGLLRFFDVIPNAVCAALIFTVLIAAGGYAAYVAFRLFKETATKDCKGAKTADLDSALAGKDKQPAQDGSTELAAGAKRLVI
jgi:hypothetical protein